jgi:hypothetical protein
MDGHQRSKKCLINWCPSISFPIKGGFPKSHQTYQHMVNMFFNPDPARRFHLVPNEGKSQYLFNPCYSTDMNPSRSYY